MFNFPPNSVGDNFVHPKNIVKSIHNSAPLDAKICDWPGPFPGKRNASKHHDRIPAATSYGDPTYAPLTSPGAIPNGELHAPP
jgi:hypothetical protein